MRRTMLAVLLLATLSPVATAQESVWTVFVTVEATIEDNWATVDIIADIGNEGPDPEFPFQVLVPDGAFVSGLTIERDGEVYEAEVKERAAARQEYDEHKASEQTGGLVEQERGTQRYAFLINVAEFTSVRATLRYEMYVGADAGTFALPLHAPVSGFGEDRGARFDVRIAHSDGVTAAWGSAGGAEEGDEFWHLQHDVAPRGMEDETMFTAFYTLAETGDGGSIVGSGGAFVHRFRAPADAEQLPVDMVMVLDTSGSMNGLKIEQLIDASRQVVGSLDEDDRLHLVDFDSLARSAWDGLRPATSETKQEALVFIGELLAGGSTHIEDGLRTGFGAFEPFVCEGLPIIESCSERSLVVAFLTDGQASSGITGTQALRDMAYQENVDKARLYGLAFGASADWQLIAGLARDQGGAAWQVPAGEGAEVDIQRWMELLTTPALENVQVAYGQEVEAFQTSAPVLFAGSELLIVGETSASRLSGTVTARAPDGDKEYAFDEAIGDGPSSLPRLVAAMRINEWQQQLDAEGQNDTLRQRIIDLAIEYGFVTQHTSLVLTLEALQPFEEGDDDRAETSADAGARDVSFSPGASGDSADDAGHDAGHADDVDNSTPGLGLVGLLAVIAGALILRRR